MLARLKRILLTQYIGAIVTACMAAQGLLAIIAMIVWPLTWALSIRGQAPVDILGHPQPTAFPWDQEIVDFVNAALNFAVAFALVRWLYGGTANDVVTSVPTTDPT